MDKIEFAETVVLVDAAYLNFIATDVKKHFEARLQRSLADMDVTDLFTYLALDAGLEKGKRNVQVLMVYDKESARLAHAYPADLTKELDGVAFKGDYGEFAFASVPCADMVTREELFMDLLTLVADAKAVKKIILLPAQEEYDDKVVEALEKLKEKEAVLFRMGQRESHPTYRTEVLAFPLMEAMGIRSEEL